jgi:aralkylamine N-acetyltransferase
VDSSKIDIRLVKDWPAAEIIALYEAGRWWDGSPTSIVEKIVSGSFAFAVAVDGKTGKAVGMGRVISDGASDAYIQDVIVLPAYRKQDIGKRIISALLDVCAKNKVTWVALVAESGTEDFYSCMGFGVMEGHTPMRYLGGKR